MNQWKTHRGDEWSYTDFWCEADASANAASPSFFIETIRPRAAPLTLERLHELLQLTHAQLPDMRIRISLASELIRDLLHELVTRKLITWQLFENPHSREAWIVSVGCMTSGAELKAREVAPGSATPR